MTIPKMGSPEYRTLANRHADLVMRRMAGDLSDATFGELCAASDEMMAIELAQTRSIEALTDDYAQLMAMGDLGGAELT